MKNSLAHFFCGLVLAGSVATASASIFTYTETGTISGSLNGVSFTDATVTLTTVADTSSITYTSGAYPSYSVIGTSTTIQIDGFNLATFTGTDSFGVIAADYSSYYSGTGVVGVIDLTTHHAILANFETSPSYDLSTAVTLTGVALSAEDTYATDLGDLVITGESGNATFTAISAVPEPSTLALTGLGGLGLFLSRRSKKNA